MRRLGYLAVAVCLVLAGPACTSKKTLPPVAPSTQAAAMQLGFAAGSFVAQGSQPMELRKESALGFARSEADLFKFMGQLQLSESDSAGVASGMLDGFADPNPARGSQLISEVMNQVMGRLQASPYPELLWAFKVGYSVGHMAETVNVLSRGTPQPEHVQAYAALTAKDRETLQADLDQSGLPAELYDAILAANVEIRSVSDMLATTRACLKIKGMVAQMQ
jgi:hypothetical protein